MFCHISQNWRGRPLISYQVIINSIAATTTSSGLKVFARLDERDYPSKVQVTRRRDRTELLLPARRPDHLRPRRRAARRVDVLQRVKDARQGRGHRAGSGQTQPALQFDRRDRATSGRGRRRRPRRVQSVPGVDTETLAVVYTVALSRPVDCLLPCTCIELLRGRARSALAATTRGRRRRRP